MKPTYYVTGFFNGRAGERMRMEVVEKVAGFPVAIYTGYDRGSFLDLYPKRKIAPSVISFERKKVPITETKRDY
jgi:hypothetical protein